MKWSELMGPGPMGRCFWCEKSVSQKPVYALGGSFRPGVEHPPSRDDGYLVKLAMSGNMDAAEVKWLWAIVAGSESEAKKEGFDLLFMLCSEVCGEELKKTLQSEIKSFDAII